MLRKERQLRIVDIIKERGSIVVDDMAKEFNVSAMTIRRDLNFLAEQNLIERHYGGAIICLEEGYNAKKVHCSKEKYNIAKKAVEFIKEGFTIFLDAGTTTFEIAKLLVNKKNLNIVTNDIEIAYMLKDSAVRLFICGGEIDKKTHSVHDDFTHNMLVNFKFDLGFFGANAVNDNLEVTTPTLSKIKIKNNIAKQCINSFLVVDASKFYKQSMHKIGYIYDYKFIITNKEFEPEELDILKSEGCTVYNI